MLLKRFPDCIATSSAEAEERVDSNASGSTFELSGRDRRFLFAVNVAQLGDVTLLSAGCSAPSRLNWVPAAFMRQTFQIRGSSNFTFGGRTICNIPSSVGCLVPSDVKLRIDSSPDYESFTIRIRPEALKSKLSALLADDVEIPEFDYSAPFEGAAMSSLRLGGLALAGEMDHVGVDLRAPVLRELSQTIIVNFLLAHKHNYTEKLTCKTASPSRKQLERIEDYITSHWENPLEIEQLAAMSNMSARSIFRLFAKEKGHSPAQLLKRTRLSQARTLLLSGSDMTVLETALKCGFHSLGHFAREYRVAFGERPYETLRRTRDPQTVRPRRPSGETPVSGRD